MLMLGLRSGNGPFNLIDEVNKSMWEEHMTEVCFVIFFFLIFCFLLLVFFVFNLYILV